MNQVISTYGKFLLEGIILVAVFVLVFTGIRDDAGNQGVFAIVGSQIETGNTDYESYNDFRGTYQTESGHAAPEIIYVTEGVLRIGTVKLSEHIKAADYEGNELPIKVTGILSPLGTELISSYDPAKEEINLAAAGLYTITVRVLDRGNRESIRIFKIPVNGETSL